MRIKSVRIQNFRVFEDETIILDSYTCLVGPNGSGKSTVLTALNIFFRESAGSPTNLLELQEEDFHGGNTSQPITITLTFTDLTYDAQKDFSDYFRQNQLVVSAVAAFDAETKRASVRQYGQRTGMVEFRKFFEADKQKASADDLKQIYLGIKATFSALPPPGTKPKMIEALRSYEDAHSELTQLIPSEDQFYGFSKGANRLARHLQWVFVPAVKDASAEQLEAKDTSLGKLMARTVRARLSFEDQLRQIRENTQARYQEMLDRHQVTLDEISAALRARLTEWAHPDAGLTLQWQQDPEKSVRVDEPFAQIIAREGPFSGNLARFGHGLQRAYLLALLQELATTGSEGAPTLILAVEEPELYQHPPQCRHMAAVLDQLSTQNAQILVTTHSPYFVSGQVFESVRMVRKDVSSSRAAVTQMSVADLATKLAEVRESTVPITTEGALVKIQQALQPALNEIFFTPFLVLTEGREDIAYVLTYLTLSGYADSLRRVGCHFVAADGKSRLLVPLAIATHLQLPAFVVFDSDAHRPDKNGSREKHRKDNLALLRLAGIANPDPFPSDNLWMANAVMWKSEIGEIVESEFDPTAWKRIKEQLEAKYGHVGDLDKNPLFISEALHQAWQQGLRSPSLEKLSHEILRFSGITK